MKIAFSNKRLRVLRYFKKAPNLHRVSLLFYVLHVLKQNFPYFGKKFMTLESLQANCLATG